MATLPVPFRGPYGSQGLHCLYQQCFFAGFSPRASWKAGSGTHRQKGRTLVLLPHTRVEAQEIPENPLTWWWWRRRHFWRTDFAHFLLGQYTLQQPLLHLPTSCRGGFSHAFLVFRCPISKCVWRVYNQKWPCNQLGVYICLCLISVDWFGHLATLRKPSWREPPRSFWHNQSPSLGIICKVPPRRMKLSNDISCLQGKSWTWSIKNNVSLNMNWGNCSEVIRRASYFALERFLWWLNSHQYLILSKIAVYCLLN